MILKAQFFQKIWRISGVYKTTIKNYKFFSSSFTQSLISIPLKMELLKETVV